MVSFTEYAAQYQKKKREAERKKREQQAEAKTIKNLGENVTQATANVMNIWTPPNPEDSYFRKQANNSNSSQPTVDLPYGGRLDANLDAVYGSGATSQDYLAPMPEKKTDGQPLGPVERIFVFNKGLESIVNPASRNDDRTWFKESNYFADGSWDKWDLSKTIGSTLLHAGKAIVGGIAEMPEKAWDAFVNFAVGYSDMQAEQHRYENAGGLAGYGERSQAIMEGAYKTEKEATKEAKEKVPEYVAQDLYDGQEIANKVIKPFGNALGLDVLGGSVLGKKSEGLAASGGQLLATAGLQAVGVPWWLTTGVTAYGSQAEEAYKEGATFEEASISATVSAAGEILTEKLSGGIKFGGKTLDDVLLKPFIDSIPNDVLKTLTNLGVDALGEGFEEVFSGVISNLGTALYKEEDLTEILLSREAWLEYLESFIGGMVLGGSSSAVKIVVGGKSVELTEVEKKVYEAVSEERIAEATKDGKKLTEAEETEIRKGVLSEIDNGTLDTGKIEKVLGGEDFEAYKKTKDEWLQHKSDLEAERDKYQQEYDKLYDMPYAEKNDRYQARQDEVYGILERLNGELKTLQENASVSELGAKLYGKIDPMIKGTRLEESYNRYKDFEADYSKYEGAKYESAVKQTLDNAVNFTDEEGGKFKNSRNVRNFIDFHANISAKTGLVFRYTTNTQAKNEFIERQTKAIAELEQIPEAQRTKEQNNGLAEMKNALEDVKSGKKIVNGDNDLSNGVITINLDSKKALNRTTGHEVMHAFEKTKGYDDLKKIVFEYAKARGVDIEAEVTAREGTYQGVKNANAEAELVADLIGDYLFTDTKFIQNLSVKHRNIFQKLWDEIKYLCKIATAGSDEARQLEQIKHQFEKVYREGVKSTDTDIKAKDGADTNVQNSLSTEQESYFADSKVRDENGNLKVMYHGTSKGGFTSFDTYGSQYGLFGTGSYFTDNKSVAESYTNKGKGSNKQVYETYLNITNPLDMDAEADVSAWSKAFPDADFSNCTTNEDCYRAMEEYFEDEQYSKWEASEIAVDAIRGMGYDGITHIGGGRVNAEGTKHQVYIAFEPEQIKNIDNIAPTKDADIRYSLTEDSEGNKLTEKQSEYFKDTKAVDRNGNILRVYHTTKNDFTVFDKSRKGEATEDSNTYLGFFFSDDAEYMQNFPEFEGGKTESYYLNMKNPIDMTNISREAFMDIVEVMGGDVGDASILYDEELEAAHDRAKLRGDSNVSLQLGNLLDELTGEFYYNDFIRELKPHYDELMSKGYDGVINYMDELFGVKEYIVLDSHQAKLTSNKNPSADADVRYSLTEAEAQETNTKLNDIGFNYDAKNGIVSYSLSSLEDAFNYKTDKDGNLVSGDDYLKARNEYVDALARSIAVEKGKPTREEYKKADRYLDSLFLVHDMIAADKDRLDYEAAINRSAWVGNVEYGGSIDFSTLCAKRRLFTGTFDAIQSALPDTVLTDKDFLNIRNLLLEHGEESPCSMCYVEGSRAKHGVYVDKFLKEYLKTNPEWKPQIADFTSTTRLEQTRIQHPEAYAEYVKAMNKLSQRKPKEASVRTDYKGEILVAFSDGSSVEIKNKNGGIRFNSFSDFEIIHALDCMQVLTDMARVGLNGQAYTKVKEFAEAFGNTGLKINLSLVAKDVDANGKLVMDEVNGMNYAEAMDIRNRYSDNVGTVIVVFNDAQLKAALADNTIDFVLPFHRSQWRKSQYALMGLPETTRDYTNIQNDRYKNPKTGRAKKAPDGNIMPNEYWDFSLSGRENAQRYLDYINENSYIPKFDFLLNKVDGKWVLPDGAVGDGYFKLLIDFKMYNNEGVGSPQNSVRPEFNMPYIQQMLNNYIGGHQAFPVAHDVVNEFVEGKKNGKYSLSRNGEQENFTAPSDNDIYGKDILHHSSDIAPVGTVAKDTTVMEDIAPVRETVPKTDAVEDIAPTREFEAINPRPETLEGEEAQWAKNKMARADKVSSTQPSAYQQTGEAIPGESLLSTGKSTKGKGKTWSTLVRNFVSKGAVFEKLSLKTGNRAVEDKYKMWKDRSESMAQYFMEKGKGDVPSLKNVYERASKAGLDKEFDLYMKHRNHVDRMKYNKGIFGNLPPAISTQTVERLQKQHPEFKEWAEDIYKINNHLKGMLVENGFITQKTADLWAKQYPNYIPIERLVGDGDVAQQGGDGIGISAPLKKAVGGNQEIETLYKTMAHRIEQVYKAVNKNAFGVELKNTLKTVSEVSDVLMEAGFDGLSTLDDSLLTAGTNETNPTFTVFENGKRVTFAITEEMYEALKPTSEAMSKEHKVLSKPTAWHKKVLTEYNLFFTARNFPKDAQEVIFNSKHAAKTYANMPNAVAELLKGKGKYITEYWENGGKSNTYFDSRKNEFKTDSTFKKVMGFVPDKISKVNDFVEAIPRLAEYMASRKQGATVEAAMTDAARVTTDFSDGGDITKFLNRNGFTFLNASVQGAAQQVRNIRQAKAEGFKGVAKLAAKYALSGLPVLLFNQLIWDDDEEYEELSEYVKDNYYIVAKYGDGQFVRIPKGRTIAVVQELFEQFGNAITGEETDWKNVYEMAVSNLAPNNPIDNNILAPIKQVAEGKTWYGDDLVPSRLQDLPAAEQYDESIDSLSKWLGEKFNVSPYKINYVLNQYSGFVGDIFLPALTPEAERGDDSFLGNFIAPLRDQFVVDSTMKNRNPSDFFSLSDELKVNASSENATDEDKLMYKYINSANYEISDLYKQKREIQNSNLSDELKYNQVRDIQAQINEKSKDALNTYENVKVDGNYATVGDMHFRLNDKGEWQNITDKQLEKQNEAVGILGITPSQYWSNKEEYDYAVENPEKYAFLEKEGIGYRGYQELDEDTKSAWSWAFKNQDKYEYFKENGVYPGDYSTYYIPMLDFKDEGNEAYSWAFENPEKATFSKAITDDVVKYREITSGLYEIRADKDSNGKPINGSAKKKKKAYIWSLDIDDGAKYILFKNEFNSVGDYNDEIIEYLNNRNDLSYDERKAILEQLGARVDAKGQIYW